MKSENKDLVSCEHSQLETKHIYSNLYKSEYEEVCKKCGKTVFKIEHHSVHGITKYAV